MRVGWTEAGGDWTLRLRLDPEDELTGVGQDGQRMELVTGACQVSLPADPGHVHPDLRALAAWTIVSPWAKSRITFDRPISAGFARSLAAGWGVDAGPVDDFADRYAGSRAALIYSSGADSIAAATLLPDAPLIHFRRVPHDAVPNRAKHVQSEVLEQLSRQAADRGRDVLVVRSDLEFLTRPWPMFPEHHAVAVGAILLAGAYDLGAVAFGTTLGGRYRIDATRYTPDERQWSAAGPWGRAFEGAGLPMMQPVGGLSEIATMMLARRSPLWDLARWCLLGGPAGPCWRCDKCLRKQLILSALDRRPLDPRITAQADQAGEAFQGEPPYPSQAVIEYGVARLPGADATVFGNVAKRLRPTEAGTAWLERCYRPALDELPERWAAGVRARLADQVEAMSSADEAEVEAWDAERRPSQRDTARSRK
ncbi:hypothetical protein Aple_052430 [Acrocarpospora pleiomorpha]|uniref:Uncharacterized protein n=1 Tax=Acrocarpospora pleiomorpha TaxID=90975 RepID=A0A5M3XNM2_9ACTN|nr:DUF6395 domain-containing protein [Acrocarpospora pleiomorpha]GES22346.1 hypothetical protein Aple_052430 [Acrocarpospora pleiomorpha]